METRSDLDQNPPRPVNPARPAWVGSRRRFSLHAALAGWSALAVASHAGGTVRAAQLGPSPAVYADDIDIVIQLLAVEHMTYALYRQGVARLAAQPLDAPALPVSLSRLRRLRDQEGRHVGLLTAILAERNGPIAAIPGYDFGYSDADGFLEVAAAIENEVVATYTGAVPALNDLWLRRAMTAVLAVEARHAAWLNGTVGVSPFPAANEPAAGKVRTLLFTERFLVR